MFQLTLLFVFNVAKAFLVMLLLHAIHSDVHIVPALSLLSSLGLVMAFYVLRMTLEVVE